MGGLEEALKRLGFDHGEMSYDRFTIIKCITDGGSEGFVVGAREWDGDPRMVGLKMFPDIPDELQLPLILPDGLKYLVRTYDGPAKLPAAAFAYAHTQQGRC